MGITQAAKIEQETTFQATVQLLDEADANLPSATLEALLLEVVESRNGTVCRSKRDANGVNDVTIDANGLCTWLGQIEDSQIVNTDTRLDGSERHLAHFEYCWNVSAAASAVDLIAVTDTDNTVTMTVTGHGLTVGGELDEHHVFITAAEDVGGLNCNGRWRIATVPDANTITFEHPDAATSTDAAGGGAVSVWIDPKVRILTQAFDVRRNRA